VRKITRDACNAFINGVEFTRENMHVHHNGDGATSRMYLFGKLIAERDGDTLRVTLAGFPTDTTRDRLNGLFQLLNLNRRIYQHQHAQYFANTCDQSAREITAHEWLKL
jgi:hypothetical protein